MSLPASEPIEKLDTLDPKNTYVFVVGPGEGEAIAIAFPDNSGWLLVDGCRSGDGTSGLVEVLEKWRRGDTPVHAYALTHPHTDHARGIVELAEVFGKAIRIVAVTPPWTVPTGPTQITSKRVIAAQVQKGLRALEKLCASGTSKKVDLVAGCSLAITVGGTLVAVHSPTAAEVAAGGDHNELSAVIEIVRGSSRVVLGSDLPTTTRGGGGWHALLGSHPGLAQHALLKIPHHCSSTSHHAPLFTKHAGTRAWSATPFNGQDLPDLVDMTGLHWILSRGSPVHLTAPPVSKHVQVPVAHPAAVSLGALRTRVQSRPTGNPTLDSGAVETTPRALSSRDSLWCFAFDAAGGISGRWRGSAALEVVP